MLLVVPACGVSPGTPSPAGGGSGQGPFAFRRVSAGGLEGRPGGAFGALVHTGGGWLAVGHVPEGGGRERPALWSSRDGRTWERQLLAGSGRLQLAAAAADGGVVAIGPGGPQSGTPSVYAGRGGRLEPVAAPDAPELRPSALAGGVGGFVAVGTAGERAGPQPVMARSGPDGRTWERVPGVQRALGGARPLDVVVAADGGVVVVGQVDGGSAAAVWHAPSLQQLGRLRRVATVEDMDVRGLAAGPDSSLLAVGATSEKGRLTPRVLASADGHDWELRTPRLAVADRHDSASGYGDTFRSVAARPSGGWVATIDYHSVELVVTSQEGRRWREAPLSGGVNPQEVPPLQAIAAGDEQAVVVSTGEDRPTMLRVTTTAHQVQQPSFPAPAHQLVASHVVAVEGGLVVAGGFRAPSPSISVPAASGGSLWELDERLRVAATHREAFAGAHIADLAPVGRSAVAVGYEQFVERNFTSGAIEPLVWEEVGLTGWQARRLPVSGSAARMQAVLVTDPGSGDGLLAVGSAVREGVQSPTGWLRAGADWEAFELARDDEVSVGSATELCRLEGRLLAFGGENGAGSLWSAPQADPATLSPLPIGAWLVAGLSPEVSDCVRAGPRTVAVGAIDRPPAAALWEDAAGGGLRLLQVDVPGTVVHSRLVAVDQDSRGRLVAVGEAGTEGAASPLLVYRLSPGGRPRAVVVGPGALPGPGGRTQLEDVAIVGDRVVVVGRHGTDAGVWVSPLPGSAPPRR